MVTFIIVNLNFAAIVVLSLLSLFGQVREATNIHQTCERMLYPWTNKSLNIQNAQCNCVMTISPEERESRLRKMRKDGKDTLLEHYSALFVQFMDEADALFSRGDHA